MAQHDYDINSTDAISGLQFRQDLNACLAAVKSTNSGVSAPSTPVAGQLWFDTSLSPALLKQRNDANTDWIEIPIEGKIGTPIGSATTTTIGTLGAGGVIHITGGTTIASLGVSKTGTVRVLIFDSTLTITHNSTSLKLIGSSNMSITSGDIATFVCENGSSGYWTCIGFTPSILSSAELKYLDGATSNIQTQINALNTTVGATSVNAQTALSASQLAVSSANFKGAWSSSTLYSLGESVLYSGIYYRAMVNSTNQTPLNNPTYWAVAIPINLGNYMPSKAEFNAVVTERRANRAGSGADNFGKGSATTTLNVNDGIHTSTTVPNTFYLGKVGGTGTSLTDAYIASINGSLILAKYLNTTTADATLLLPPAPTVLPSTATLTQQQIDSGVIKHADTSNSGLIVNGKFDTDTIGWTATTSTLSVISTALRVTLTSTIGYASQSFATVIGKKYTVEYSHTAGTSAGIAYVKIGTSAGASTNATSTSVAGRNTIEFTATATTTYISIEVNGASSEYDDYDNIAVFPADAISRSDLVFLESWHEDVSEKDFVYPLGNVQYLGTTGDSGTTVAGAFAGSATYSLFSDTWQADSALIGKGYVWSTLSDANKKAFVANPENNCYLDGDKVIQVRYRMRVQLGEDTWTMGKATIQGKAVAQSTTLFTSPVTTVDAGLYSNTSTTYTYTGTTTSAIEICRVARRNQGMTHQVYNPNGTKLASDSLPWYSTTVSFTSIADCFTESKLLATSGYIGTTTGRADGIFYDQVHEGDITDLRNNSRGINDYIRTTEKWFAKLQDATYRGTEGEKYTEAKVQTTNGTVATVEVNDGTKYKSGDTIYIYDLTASAVKGRFTVKSISTNTLTVDVAFAKLANNYLISGVSSTRTKSNTMTVIDVIGNPSNYQADWKTQNPSLISLHTAEDGTSILPTGTTGSDGLAVYKLSRKANATPLQVLKSTDSGATWTALTVTTHYTFSTTTNAITFTAGNIPLVAHLIMVTYQTHTNMAVAAVNSEALVIGDMYVNNNGYIPDKLGVYLVEHLSGKTPTVTTSSDSNMYKKLSEIKISLNKLATYSKPEHSQISLNVGSNATKVFPYLTHSNGKAYLQLVFKELKYGSYAAPTTVTAASATYTINMTYKINIAGCALDGKVIQWTASTATVAVDWSLYDVSPTGVIYLLSSGAVYANARLYDGDSWGDDSKFNIVDNVSTTTDTNGATVLIGQKRIELPYFIEAKE